METFFGVLPAQFFFLYELITNNARKLEVAESNLMEIIPSSLSLLDGSFFYSLSRSRLSRAHSVSLFLSLSLSLSLSFLNFFVDAAVQLLLCGVMSLSIGLTSRPCN